MSRRTETIDAGYFDRLYAADEDPWQFRTSAYEQAKYADTLSVLEEDRYRDILEVGCERVTAIDGSAVALAVGQRQGAGMPHVSFERRMLPDGFPAERYDLIVLSEVVCYLVEADVLRLAALCDASLEEGGETVLCHWLGRTDSPLSGDAAAEIFVGRLTGAHWRHRTVRQPAYRLDPLRKKMS